MHSLLLVSYRRSTPDSATLLTLERYIGKGLYSKVAMFWLEHCTHFSLQEELLHRDSQSGCRRKHERGS